MTAGPQAIGHFPLAASLALAALMAIAGGCQILDKKSPQQVGQQAGQKSGQQAPGNKSGQGPGQSAAGSSGTGRSPATASDAMRAGTKQQTVVFAPSGERGVPSQALPPGMDEFTRAKILKEQGLTEEALNQFLAAIDENPLLTAAYVGAADIQREQGNLPEAEKNYAKAAELEPFNYNAQYWHAVVLHELQQFSKAIPAYLRALQLRPDSFESNSGLAAAYLQAGEPREALPFAQRAIQLNNEDYSARTTLGVIYAALNDHESAIVEFQQAAELGELSPKLLLNLAESYGKTKRYDEMVNILDEVIRREPSAAAYERMGSGLFRLSRFDEAQTAFKKATELDDRYFPAFNGVGVCLLQRWLATGLTDNLARDEGLRALRRSLQIKQDQPRVLELLGRHQNR